MPKYWLLLEDYTTPGYPRRTYKKGMVLVRSMFNGEWGHYPLNFPDAWVSTQAMKLRPIKGDKQIIELLYKSEPIEIKGDEWSPWDSF